MLTDRGVQPVSGAHEDLYCRPHDVLAVPHVGVVRTDPLFDDNPLLGQASQHLADASLAGCADEVSDLLAGHRVCRSGKHAQHRTIESRRHSAKRLAEVHF